MRSTALVLLVATLLVGVVAVESTQGRAAPARRTGVEVFQGLGTWMDVYDTNLYASANAVAARLAAQGVGTVWIETSNDGSKTDIVQPAGLGRMVDALHAQGISTVAWYLPGHDRTGKDLRRARAMLSFRTPTGDAFDGVALDIESLHTKNVKQRTARMLSLLDTLRNEAGSTPVAAITYPPRAFERHLSWWPGFPWAAIAKEVDAIVPMLYTGGGFKGYDATYGYVARSLRLLRAAVGDEIPVHAAGGVANQMTKEELKAFDDAVEDDGTATGWSLYDYQTMTPAAWAAMTRLNEELG
jgi:hypothetical protein